MSGKFIDSTNICRDFIRLPRGAKRKCEGFGPSKKSSGLKNKL